VLAAGLAIAHAAPACVTQPGPWDTYTAAILFKRNHPSSVIAKEVVKQHICDKFGISPCAVSTSSDPTKLSIVRDLDLLVPQALMTDVTFFLMQYRLGQVHGAPGGYDLDVMIYPNTNCPNLDVVEHSIHIGHRMPFNTNLLPAKSNLAASDIIAASEAPIGAGTKEDDTIFTKCSSDATCYPPLANNTQCTGNSKQTAAHFHFYYVDNNPAVIAAVQKFTTATTKVSRLQVQ
jgi:hypothetical protein